MIPGEAILPTGIMLGVIVVAILSMIYLSLDLIRFLIRLILGKEK